MARPIPGKDYPRWNNLFDTINSNDRESLRKILQAANTAEKFHPFNLKLHKDTTLNNAEMIALRDLCYAFNRNFLCRDIIRHLILFSRHDDDEFTLGREIKFYIEILKNTQLSPVRQPMVYLQVRREFCFRALDLGYPDEDEAMGELDRWASWGVNGVWDGVNFEVINIMQGQNETLGNAGNGDVNMGDGSEIARAKDGDEAGIFEAAKILISMRMQRH